VGFTQQLEHRLEQGQWSRAHEARPVPLGAGIKANPNQACRSRKNREALILGRRENKGGAARPHQYRSIGTVEIKSNRALLQDKKPRKRRGEGQSIELTPQIELVREQEGSARKKVGAQCMG